MLVGMCSIFDFHNAASSVGSEIIARRTNDNSLVGSASPAGARYAGIGERGVPENPSYYPEQSRYAAMRTAARNVLGISGTGGSGLGIPLVLICDYCGNIQYFRWDLADGIGKYWLP